MTILFAGRYTCLTMTGVKTGVQRHAHARVRPTASKRIGQLLPPTEKSEPHFASSRPRRAHASAPSSKCARDSRPRYFRTLCPLTTLRVGCEARPSGHSSPLSMYARTRVRAPLFERLHQIYVLSCSISGMIAVSARVVARSGKRTIAFVAVVGTLM